MKAFVQVSLQRLLPLCLAVAILAATLPPLPARAQAPALVATGGSLDFGSDEIDREASLAFEGSQAVDYRIVASEPWLSVVPASGTLQPPSDSQPLRVTVDRRGLTSGEHNATLSVERQSDGQVMDTISVVMQVTARTLSTWDLGAVAGLESRYLLLAVAADAGETFRWEVVDLPPWLLFDQSAGDYTLVAGGTTLLALAAATDSSLETPGEVLGTLQLDTNQGPRDVPVRMLAQAPPDLTIASVSLEPLNPTAMEPAEIVIQIKNVGGPYRPVTGRYDLEVRLSDAESGNTWRYLLRSDRDALPELAAGASTFRTWTFTFTRPEIDRLDLTLLPHDDEAGTDNNGFSRSNLTVEPASSTLLSCLGLAWNTFNVWTITHAGTNLDEFAELSGDMSLALVRIGRVVQQGGDAGEMLAVMAETIISLGFDLARQMALKPAKVVIGLVKHTLEGVKNAWQCGSYLADVLHLAHEALFHRGENVQAAVTGGDVNLVLENDAGQRAGFLADGSVVNEIDGAEAYSLGDDLKTVWVPEAGLCRATVWPVPGPAEDRAGSKFELLAAEGDSHYAVQYRNVDLPAGSQATVEPGDPAFLLRIDDDGDGGADRLVAPARIETQPRRRRYLPLVLRDGGEGPAWTPPAPASPSPADGDIVETAGNLVLAWSSGDLAGHSVTYDLYLDDGDGTPGRLVANNLAQPTFTTGALDSVDQGWRVVARSVEGAVAHGPVWSFGPPPLYAGWQPVGAGSASGGGLSQGGDSATIPDLVAAPDGSVYAAWEDSRSGTRQIYVLRWNGSAWVEVGAGSASGGGISNSAIDASMPDLAVAPDGTLYVAWNEYADSDMEIYVRRWDGIAWTEAGSGSASGGGISDNDATSRNPSMAVAADGTVYVAWYDASNGPWEIYVRRWSGGTWTEAGPGSASGGGISATGYDSIGPSLALQSNGYPCVAWIEVWSTERNIYGRCFHGAGWITAGAGGDSGRGISNTVYDSTAPTLAAAPDGSFYLAWQEEATGDDEICVCTWNGSTGYGWHDVGANSPYSGGISDNDSESRYPTLAVAADGTLYAAWQDYGGGDVEIYVLRWDGSAWAEAGRGSARAAGISSNDQPSIYPAAVVAPDGVPYVAWQDWTPGVFEVYALRWLGE